MKKILLLSVFMLLGLIPVKSQMFLDTIWFDIHWKQSALHDGQYYRLVWADTSGKIQFFVKDFYRSGKIQMDGTYKAINPDVRDGNFVFYYENGNRQSVMTYRDNQVVGEVKEWFSNGNPKSVASYSAQTLNGLYKAWREDGSPALEVSYKNGDLDGPFISYYSNGKKVRQDTYANGELKRKRCFTFAGKDTSWFPYIEMPEFPGGQEKYTEFIEQNLVYPAEALTRKLQGRVDVEISISREGQVLKATVVKSDRELFNEEAIRLVKSSPSWKPGKKDGQLVEISITVPVWFKFRKD
jgi:periplasmic protein TonB